MENNTNTQQNAGIVKSGKSRRGFASMDKERHKMVSSKGGKAFRTSYAGRNDASSPAAFSSPLN